MNIDSPDRKLAFGAEMAGLKLKATPHYIQLSHCPQVLLYVYVSGLKVGKISADMVAFPFSPVFSFPPLPSLPILFLPSSHLLFPIILLFS